MLDHQSGNTLLVPGVYLYLCAPKKMKILERLKESPRKEKPYLNLIFDSDARHLCAQSVEALWKDQLT